MLAAPDRPVWRLSGELSPAFPAPACGKKDATAATAGAPAPGAAKRVQSGGEIQAPAYELVAAAAAAGKLDELAQRVEANKPEAGADPIEFERGRLALLCLIQIAKADDSGAARTLSALEPLLKKLPDLAPTYTRWPAVLVAYRALERPALRGSASQLVDLALEQARKRGQAYGEFQSYTDTWEQLLLSLRGRAAQLRSPRKLMLPCRRRSGRTRPSQAGLA